MSQKQIEEYDPKECLILLDFINNYNLVEDFPWFWANFPKYIVKSIYSFEFEEMCLLYYIYAKHGALKEQSEMKGDLDVLRDYILLWMASQQRRRSLQIGSNYYKVLEVVDINDFYMK
jgi:hypothetical protein